jgi:hypothetical protein
MESAAMVNPAHDVLFYVRTPDAARFIENESRLNPVFKACEDDDGVAALCRRRYTWRVAPCVQVLAGLPNFHVIAIPSDVDFAEDFYRRTGIDGPLRLVREGKWLEDKYIASHLSDFYRYMLVHLNGGIYLDMDSISVQDLRRYSAWKTFVIPEKKTGNQGPFEEENFISGAFSDVKGGLLTRRALEMIADKFDAKVWGCIGPLLIKAVAKTVPRGMHVINPFDFMPVYLNNVCGVCGAVDPHCHEEQGGILMQGWAKSL